MAKTKETEITEADYLVAKKTTLEFELKNIPKFYAKLTLRRSIKENDGVADIYFDDIQRLSDVIEDTVRTSLMVVVGCSLVSKMEFDKFYLPF